MCSGEPGCGVAPHRHARGYRIKRRRAEQADFLEELQEQDPAAALTIVVWCYLQREDGVDRAFFDAERWACGDEPVSPHVAGAWVSVRDMARVWLTEPDGITDEMIDTMHAVAAWADVAAA